MKLDAAARKFEACARAWCALANWGKRVFIDTHVRIYISRETSFSSRAATVDCKYAKRAKLVYLYSNFTI